MDETKIEQAAMRVVTDMGGAFIMALGYVGDRLGLFKALQGDPLSCADLAEKTGLNERYVLEWLRAMTAAEYIEHDREADRYYLTDEQAFVLADENSPMFVGGAFHMTTPSVLNTPRILDAFRNGGGIPYAEIGHEVGCAIERFFEPGYRHFMVNQWFAAVEGLNAKLEAGANVLDVGCGRGQSTVHMAKAFPASKFLGVDYHRDSVAAAMKLADEHGVANVKFIQASAEQVPADEPFDLICSFDCIHDMVDPSGAVARIRELLADDGLYVWSEPNASHDPTENRNPIGRTFHAVSPLHCMTVSLAHGGAGLGTVIGEKGARELAETAGFTRFERLDIPNPFNQFFALRK